MRRRPLSLLANHTLALALFLVFVFLIGGGSRDDILSLPVLRIGAALFIGYALYFLRPAQLTQHRIVVALLGAFSAWLLLQLVPLPPGIWMNFAGRDLVVRAGELAGIEQPWRPISVIPWRTVNALLALLIPWAALLLGVQVSLAGNRGIPGVIVVIALFSALLGILQMLGPDGGSLYFYRVTNPESAVGLFSNRNHNAAFLAASIPLIAYLVATAPKTEPKRRPKRAEPGIGNTTQVATADDRPLLFGALAVFVLGVGILATGSRGGMIAGVVGLTAAILIVFTDSRRSPVRSGKRLLAYCAGFAIIGGTLLVLGIISQNEAADRIINLEETEEVRLQVWGPIAELVPAFGWTGSGIGTFVEVYESAEPDFTIGDSYLNHAHNDWLETALTGGWPALGVLALSLIAGIFFAARAWLPSSSRVADRPLARAASASLIIMALFSLTDYPVRTPSLAAFFIVMALGLLQAARSCEQATEELASARS